MLGIVWPLPAGPCVSDQAEDTVVLRPVFSSSISSFPPPSPSSVVEELERAKEKVGVARTRMGTRAWKEAVSVAGRETKVRGMNRASDKLEEMIDLCLPSLLNPHHPRGREGVASTNVLLLCEAPGGFADCLLKKGIPPSSLNATSLASGIQFSPSIKRSGVHILSPPGGGDITLPQARDFLHHLPLWKGGGFSFITADGARDADDAPHLAEKRHSFLLASEVDAAFRSQGEGGSLVVKLLGMAEEVTIDILLLLCCSYEEVSLVKPLSSRSVNDERYVVCIGFLPSSPFVTSFLSVYTTDQKAFLSNQNKNEAIETKQEQDATFLVRLMEGRRPQDWEREVRCTSDSFALSQTKSISSALSQMQRGAP